MAVVELSAAEVGERAARPRGPPVDRGLQQRALDGRRGRGRRSRRAARGQLDARRRVLPSRQGRRGLAQPAGGAAPRRAARGARAGSGPAPTSDPMYSTVTGEPIDGRELDAEYWMRNLRETVQFSSAVHRASRTAPRRFVEISPHPILLPAVEQSEAGGHRAARLPSMRRQEAERAVMLESLGALYARGYPVEWARLTRGACVSLPAYPWQRERFWYPIAEGGKPARHPHGRASAPRGASRVVRRSRNALLAGSPGGRRARPGFSITGCRAWRCCRPA